MQTSLISLQETSFKRQPLRPAVQLKGNSKSRNTIYRSEDPTLGDFMQKREARQSNSRKSGSLIGSFDASNLTILKPDISNSDISVVNTAAG